MIRVSESVLPGHPDKFCDQIADEIVNRVCAFEEEAYAQIEVGVWSDEMYINGTILTSQKIEIDFKDVVRYVGDRIGYVENNHIDASKYKIRDYVCRLNMKDPTFWSRYVNDQSVVIGWAGYDEKTSYLPPEHFLSLYLKDEVFKSCLFGYMKGLGPDGKIIVIVEEKDKKFLLKEVLLTIMHPSKVNISEVVSVSIKTLNQAYIKLKEYDSRWASEINQITFKVNPNGEFTNGGSNGDNGQTGRKLVMDYYGPRIPIGGGALSGKIIGHIDRVAAYAARHAAVKAVKSGAGECLVRLAYAPNVNLPLNVLYEMKNEVKTEGIDFFDYRNMVKIYSPKHITSERAQGKYFFDLSLPWNG
ncbi:MAG: methionine adenosyltransferase domain-containing protein [Elusimicrobiota bacterium]